MTEHVFLVTVSGCSEEQAAQVMAERINVDEDYGFEYTIGFEPLTPVVDERDVANAESNRILAERKRQEGS